MPQAKQLSQLQKQISTHFNEEELPPHHLPFPENKLFTGRETRLAQLHEQLQKDTPVAVTQAVAGLGGVGKTQLALAYCYRHLDEYDLIQWLRADETTNPGGRNGRTSLSPGPGPSQRQRPGTVTAAGAKLAANN